GVQMRLGAKQANEHFSPRGFAPEMFVPSRFAELEQRRQDGMKTGEAAGHMPGGFELEPLIRLGAVGQSQALFSEWTALAQQGSQRFRPIRTPCFETFP